MKVELHQEKETLLGPLYLRALDAGKRYPILGDRYAQPLLDRLDYDLRRMRALRGNSSAIAARALLLDTWTQRFLATYPDGLVLHLGAGLDSRPFRVTRPPMSQWIDVDYPEVIALRQRLYEPVAGVRMLAASVTEADWWGQLPVDRPTLVLAEGLLMYLSDEQVHRLIDRIQSHFPVGEIAFDATNQWIVTISRWHPALRKTGTSFRWALTEPRDLETLHPGLRLRDEVYLVALTAAHNRHPLARATLRARTRVRPSFWRDSVRLLRYIFGRETEAGRWPSVGQRSIGS